MRTYNVEPRHRVLLAGPPGNGKTTLAEALADARMVPLFVVRYESIIGSFLGETSQRLRRVFEHIASRRCVLFFDVPWARDVATPTRPGKSNASSAPS
ncbi:MAG TPA: AAA family ATPase [Lamprocystis sp. (in: g-proteobacteria)]|nr:AAA family ATPase [Lamprocystis sp. (in: g-proteobacteria)]